MEFLDREPSAATAIRGGLRHYPKAQTPGAATAERLPRPDPLIGPVNRQLGTGVDVWAVYAAVKRQMNVEADTVPSDRAPYEDLGKIKQPISIAENVDAAVRFR